MRKTFDAELQELNYEMINMSAAAEDSIDVVTESLSSSDDAAAKAAIEMTKSMDQMERDIENRCLRLLLHRRPVRQHRGDLPAASAAEAGPYPSGYPHHEPEGLYHGQALHFCLCQPGR